MKADSLEQALKECQIAFHDSLRYFFLAPRKSGKEITMYFKNIEIISESIFRIKNTNNNINTGLQHHIWFKYNGDKLRINNKEYNTPLNIDQWLICLKDQNIEIEWEDDVINVYFWV